MMRKNKFVNPIQKAPDILQYNQLPNEKQGNHPLIQNKIYFPASYQDRLMPYKIQTSYHKNTINFGQVRSNQMYDIKQKSKNKDRKQRRLSFGRENKFEKLQDSHQIQINPYNNKGFVKYSTIQLRNLPGINSTASGTTIYRSKNIKSSNRLLIQRSITKRGKSQFRRNSSVRNQESIQAGIPKSKSNKQTSLKLKDKNMVLYQTYFSSKSGLHFRSNSCRPFENGHFIQQNKQEVKQNIEDILFKNVVHTELYENFDGFQQQYFF